MVKVKAYHVRTKSSDGTTFITLELEGGLEMVQSQDSGKFFCVVRRTSAPANFDEQTAKSLIGSTLPGKIARVESAPYDYTVKSTGEVIQLAHSYQYQPDDVPVVANRIVELV